MQLSSLIQTRIKTDNIFSLKMALRLSERLGESVKQLTLERQADRSSFKLLHPACIDFYKSEGYSEKEIFENSPAK